MGNLKKELDKIKSDIIRKSPVNWKRLGFAMLPTKILMDDRLCRSALLVTWVLIVHTFRGKDYCFPSLNTIAKEAHCSSPTICKAIKQLKQYGYLEVESGKKDGKPNKYYLKVQV